MPDENQESTDTAGSSSENIEIPPISKQTAGAATGAVLGSCARKRRWTSGRRRWRRNRGVGGTSGGFAFLGRAEGQESRQEGCGESQGGGETENVSLEEPRQETLEESCQASRKEKRQNLEGESSIPERQVHEEREIEGQRSARRKAVQVKERGEVQE
jgi:hypothetical protein